MTEIDPTPGPSGPKCFECNRCVATNLVKTEQTTEAGGHLTRGFPLCSSCVDKVKATMPAYLKIEVLELEASSDQGEPEGTPA